MTEQAWKVSSSRPARLVRRWPEPIRKPLVHGAKRVLQRKMERNPTLDPAVRERFVERLRPDIEEFRELTGKSFDTWG